jgi:hypothetical protein
MLWIGLSVTWRLLTILPCYLLVVRLEARARTYEIANPACFVLAIAAFLAFSLSHPGR